MFEYDNFDDYVEVIFQMFFITVFSAVFPLSTTFSYIFNIIEIESDKFKLIKKLYIRSLPCKVKGIGMWVTVMFMISVMSVYSNITFFAFNSYDYFSDSSKIAG